MPADDPRLKLRTTLGLQPINPHHGAHTDAALLELLQAPTPVRMHGLTPLKAHDNRWCHNPAPLQLHVTQALHGAQGILFGHSTTPSSRPHEGQNGLLTTQIEQVPHPYRPGLLPPQLLTKEWSKHCISRRYPTLSRSLHSPSTRERRYTIRESSFPKLKGNEAPHHKPTAHSRASLSRRRSPRTSM